MAKDVRFKVSQKGAENVSGKFGKVDKSLMSMAKGAMGAVASIYAIKKGFEATVGASIKQEKIFRSLQSSVELTGKSWTSAKGELDGLFDSLQATTVYGDTDSAQMLQKLIDFSGDYEASVKSLALAQDMASSSAFNEESATRYLGMALTGNVEMLGRYVPELKASTNEQLKNMDSAEKAAYAIEVLTKKYGGMAANELKTVSGMTKQFKNYAGDLGEAIGDTLLPVLNETLPVMIDIIKALNSLGKLAGMEQYKKGTELIDEQLNALDAWRDGLIESNKWNKKVSDEYSYVSLVLKNMNAEYINGTVTISQLTKDIDEMLGSMGYNVELIKETTKGNQELTDSIEEQEKAFGVYLKKAENSIKAKEQELIFIERLKTEYPELAEAMGLIVLEYEKLQELPQLFRDVSIAIGEMELIDTEGTGLAFDTIAAQGQTTAELWIAEWTKGNQDWLSGTQEVTNQMGNVYSNFLNLKKAKLSNELNAEMKAIESKEKRGVITAEEAAAQMELVREKYRKKEEAAAKAMKPIKYAQAISGTALAVINAMQTKPFIPLGLIAAGMAGVAGAVQVATIAAQPYATGGIVPGSGTGDNVPAMLTPGEVVLNAAQQTNLAGGIGSITINVQGNLIATEEEADRFAAIIQERSRLGFNQISVNA